MSSIAGLLSAEHRSLDDLFGGYLATLPRVAEQAARRALELFDREFRHHAGREEAILFAALASRSEVLASQIRELTLEHTQIRELCSISLEKMSRGRPEDVRALAINLARRFERHERFEEESFYPAAERELPAEEHRVLREQLEETAGGRASP